MKKLLPINLLLIDSLINQAIANSTWKIAMGIGKYQSSSQHAYRCTKLLRWLRSPLPLFFSGSQCQKNPQQQQK